MGKYQRKGSNRFTRKTTVTFKELSAESKEQIQRLLNNKNVSSEEKRRLRKVMNRT
jgi:hypothetical protein